MDNPRELIPYGYAPGNYMNRCLDCSQMHYDCDKRAGRCRPCAEKRRDAALAAAPTPHHCAPEDVSELVDRLEELNDPQRSTQRDIEHEDLRGLFGVCARVIRHLTAPTPQAGEPVAQDRTLHEHLMLVVSRAFEAGGRATDGTWSNKVALRAVCKAIAEDKNLRRKLATAPTQQEADARDAARYRFLRQEHERVNPVCHVVWKQDMDRNSGKWVNAANLDVAIDAAMGELK